MPTNILLVVATQTLINLEPYWDATLWPNLHLQTNLTTRCVMTLTSRIVICLLRTSFWVQSEKRSAQLRSINLA